MKRLTNEEIADIMRRVEEAKPYGHGVGKLALEDVPKLIAEIDELKEEIDDKDREIQRYVEIEWGDDW